MVSVDSMPKLSGKEKTLDQQFLRARCITFSSPQDFLACSLSHFICYSIPLLQFLPTLRRFQIGNLLKAQWRDWRMTAYFSVPDGGSKIRSFWDASGYSVSYVVLKWESLLQSPMACKWRQQWYWNKTSGHRTTSSWVWIILVQSTGLSVLTPMAPPDLWTSLHFGTGTAQTSKMNSYEVQQAG